MYIKSSSYSQVILVIVSSSRSTGPSLWFSFPVLRLFSCHMTTYLLPACCLHRGFFVVAVLFLFFFLSGFDINVISFAVTEGLLQHLGWYQCGWVLVLYPGEVKCTRISSQISTLIVRMSIQGSSGGTSIPRATAAAGVQKPCHPLRTSTCTGRAVRCPPVRRARGGADTGVDVWSDANRHLLTLHSLDHLNSRGWQGKWASLGYKSPNLDWLEFVSGPAGWHERARH